MSNCIGSSNYSHQYVAGNRVVCLPHPGLLRLGRWQAGQFPQFFHSLDHALDRKIDIRGMLNLPRPKRRTAAGPSSDKPIARRTWLGSGSVDVQAAPLLTARLPISSSSASPSTLPTDVQLFGRRNGVLLSYRWSSACTTDVYLRVAPSALWTIGLVVPQGEASRSAILRGRVAGP